MPQEYSATDPRTGLQVTIRGEFPADPDERVRVARTANLFTRLISTILATENEYERRERFRAIETQLEVADALIKGDMAEVQRLLRETLQQMGVTEEQMQEVQRELRRQLEAMGQEVPPELRNLLFPDEGEPPAESDAPAPDVEPPSKN
jgi:hypothetical protein